MRLRAEAALLAVTIVWSGTFLAVQFAMSMSGPLFFVGLRFAIAATVAAIIAGKSLRDTNRAELVAGGAIGITVCAGYSLQSEGLKHVLSSESAFITALYVPIVPALQWVLLRRPPHTATWAGVGLAFFGMTLIGTGEAGFKGIGRGELVTLASAFVFAGEILLIGFFAPSVDARRVTAVQLAVTSLFAFMLMPVFREGPPENVPWQLLTVAGALGLASSIIQLSMNWAQRFVSPARATIIYSTEPVWAGLVGLAAGERLTALGWVGGGLVLAGVLVSELRGRNPLRE